MAIYNNREVSVIAPTHVNTTPDTVRVAYNDGSQETVSAGKVQFTEEEKKTFIKNYPSRFDNVQTISDEDLKAVRLGIAPPSSPELKLQAEAQVRRERMAEETRKTQDKVKADADKRLDKELSNSKAANQPLVSTDTGVVNPNNNKVMAPSLSQKK